MSEAVPRRGTVAVGDLAIAYDELGAGEPLVLIMGIGAQRIFWDLEMVGLFAARGFRVIRFDHRDVGESTHLRAPVPRPGRTLARRMLGLRVEAPYTLSDMARDVVGLLDGLAIERAHVVGVSLGGMVAQHLAIEHPERLRSMTSIMSTPGARRYFPEPRALRALFAPRPTTADESAEHTARLFAEIGSPAWPLDGDRLRAIGRRAFEHANPRGFMRHFAAVLASGDRRAGLRRSQVPTLVIHGTRDPMFPLAAGRALAQIMPNATWLPIAGMGHDLPPELWPTLVAAIARHAGL
jgi:pimeloyl-ACP methyl ester carboxylesterase